jgi:hypothetical protein
MNRDRHSHRHGNNSNWKNNQNNQQQGKASALSAAKQIPVSRNAVSADQIREEDEAIHAFKTANQPVCPICGKPILELSSAIGNRGSGEPIHFDCAIDLLAKEETLAEGDKIIYIGQGRFGVVNIPNPHDQKHFTIKKVIDWEAKDSRSVWRDQMSDLYSQIR